MIDPLIFFCSVVVGLPIGFIMGLAGALHANTTFAQQIFDSLLKLREQAKSQMDAYDDSLKPTKKAGAKQKP